MLGAEESGMTQPLELKAYDLVYGSTYEYRNGYNHVRSAPVRHS